MPRTIHTHSATKQVENTTASKTHNAKARATVIDKNSHNKQTHATTTNENLSQSSQTHATTDNTTKPTKPTSQMPTTKPYSLHLSKSQYLRGVQCHKRLWLYKYKRELLDEPTPSQLARFQAGNEVGELALKLFDCKEKIAFSEGDFSAKIERTKALMKSGVSSIAEATFSHNGILVMVDILQITADGLIINEVKSSTGLKSVYIDDLAVQYFVLSGAGYKVIGANLVHIDSAYTRKGALEVQKLFAKIDCLQAVIEKQSEVEQNLCAFEKILEDSTNAPNIAIGAQCDCPYECDFKGVCWSEVPSENSVFEISRLDWRTKFALYHSGIARFSDIKDFSTFSASQILQIKCALDNATHIDKVKIREFLATIRYPVYHLDFETFQEAVPSFDSQCPYMQVPFQYSLHIDYGGGDESIEHREFLADAQGDPRVALVESLVRDIPRGAFILAYNASFEKGVMRKLALTFPQYAEILEHFCENTADLMTPFAQKAYYHPAMRGSYSIKAVLPALMPEMEQAYKDLELVHNGGEAMEAFPALKSMDRENREAYRHALLAYCKLDTLAMVKVLGKLREVVKND